MKSLTCNEVKAVFGGVNNFEVYIKHNNETEMNLLVFSSTTSLTVKNEIYDFVMPLFTFIKHQYAGYEIIKKGTYVAA